VRLRCFFDMDVGGWGGGGGGGDKHIS